MLTYHFPIGALLRSNAAHRDVQRGGGFVEKQVGDPLAQRAAFGRPVNHERLAHGLLDRQPGILG